MLVGDAIFCPIFLMPILYFPFSSTSFWKIEGYFDCILRLRIAFDGFRFLGKKRDLGWSGALA